MGNREENRKTKPVSDVPGAAEELWLPVSAPNALLDTQRDNAPDEGAFSHSLADLNSPPDGMQRMRYSTSNLVSRLLDIMRTALNLEIERGAAFLWAPVFFGAGCICYFTLPREPSAAAFPSLSLIAFLIAWRIGREHWTNTVILALAIFTAGASAGQVRSMILNTTVLPFTGVAQITGRVLKAEFRPNGSARYTLDVSGPGARFEFRGVSEFPRKIRLTARKGSINAQVGALLDGRARLGPPPGPAFPAAMIFRSRHGLTGSALPVFFWVSPRLLGRPPRQVFHGHNLLP